MSTAHDNQHRRIPRVRIVRYARTPSGLRCYVLGRRLHHFTAGLVLVAVGVVLCWHDRRDWRVCVSDFLALTEVPTSRNQIAGPADA